jgi:hypothetical protein
MDSLGLSIGATNMVAVRAGQPPVRRRSVLTVFPHRPAEVGLPGENPDLTESGLVLWGFADRVGDPVPIVAPDGSSHRAELLAAEALAALARAAGAAGPQRLAITVPAHWGPAAVDALRAAVRARPELSSEGAAPELIPDTTAALTALAADPGLPTRGVLALLDFGGTGTTVALVDAGAGLRPIGAPVRSTELSGELIDQAILNHVLAGLTSAGGADPAGTAAVGVLGRLRNECRRAKEQLSADTVAVIPVEQGGTSTDVRLTRAELESLLAGPLGAVLDTVGDLLERNRIPAANLSAVATVGGGAAIPLFTERLSQQLRVPVVTVADPGAAAATGVRLLAERGPSADAMTGMAPTGLAMAAGAAGAAPDAPTGLAPAADDPNAPTGLAPAAGDATGMAPASWATHGDPGGEGSPDATSRGLAWSEGATGAEPVPYTGPEYAAPPQGATAARPPVEFDAETEQYDAAATPLPWYRRPPLLFGIAAVAALASAGGLAVTLSSSDADSTPVTTTITLPNGEVITTALPPSQSATVTYTGDNGEVTSSMVPPPTTTAPTTTTESSTTEESSTTTTTTESTTGTTTTAPTTTTTQPTTTTTQPTTTQPTTTQPTSAPPTTTEAPPTTTQAPPTTTQAPPPTTQPPTQQPTLTQEAPAVDEPAEP